MKDRAIHILLGLIGLGLAFYLWTQLEYYKEERDVGWSLSAYINPYLAAEQFLRKIGKEIDSSYQLELSQSLSTDATLFISNANDVLDERRANGLIEWMENGGHVIIAAQVLYEGKEDVFLSHFGVEKYSYETELFPGGEDQEDAEEEKSPSLGDSIREREKILREEDKKAKDREQAEKEGRLDTLEEELIYQEGQYEQSDLITLTFDGVEGDFSVLIDQEEYLDHPSLYWDDEDEYEGYKPFYWEGNDAGVNFMQFNVEDGLLTVIGDGSIWNNERIGLFDHAHLLQLLTDGSDKVVFLRGVSVPSLIELIWTHYRELCVVLGFTLVLWIAYRGRRFGPVVDSTYRGRRSFREHLSAVGDFYWRHKQRDELLKNAREAIWRENSIKFFSAKDKNDEEKLQRLASLTDKSVDYIRTVMQCEPPQDEFKFYQLIQSLQQIRKQL